MLFESMFPVIFFLTFPSHRQNYFKNLSTIIFSSTIENSLASNPHHFKEFALIRVTKDLLVSMNCSQFHFPLIMCVFPIANSSSLFKFCFLGFYDSIFWLPLLKLFCRFFLYQFITQMRILFLTMYLGGFVYYHSLNYHFF